MMGKYCGWSPFFILLFDIMGFDVRPDKQLEGDLFESHDGEFP